MKWIAGVVSVISLCTSIYLGLLGEYDRATFIGVIGLYSYILFKSEE